MTAPALQAAGELGIDPLATRRTSGIWRDTLRNILRQRNAVVGIVLLGSLLFVAVLADQLATYPPDQVLIGVEDGVKKSSPPCIHLLGCPASQPEHFMGTDSNVRDEFSRVVHGARVSLFVGFVTVGAAIVIGALVGLIAGFFGGWTDNILMRLMDVLLVFPALLLAIAIVTALGASLINAQIAIAVVAIPIYARIMRASVLSVRENDYLTASRALGESSIGLLFRRILPNAVTPLIVAGTLGIGGAVLDVAALSFLGLGASPPLAEWGSMIALESGRLFTAPHLIFFPGLALVLTVFGFNLLGDGIRDALDPRLNR
ncbi:MAG TPA: ABC transporter permease [Candidatus Limnocylindrales bacterium]|nr:ABC transporter permease [Candidatus Limnocylindrales bacterium]